MISITHRHDGTTIHRDGKRVAMLSDPATIGSVLRKLGVKPETTCWVQHIDGRDWRVCASTYLKEIANAP